MVLKCDEVFVLSSGVLDDFEFKPLVFTSKVKAQKFLHENTHLRGLKLAL